MVRQPQTRNSFTTCYSLYDHNSPIGPDRLQPNYCSWTSNEVAIEQLNSRKRPY